MIRRTTTFVPPRCRPRHDPARARLESPPGHRRRGRRARGGGLRHSRGGQSEAVLLLVAGVVPVLPEPGPRRAVLRADPVRDPGGLGHRAATDRGDDLRDAAGDGGSCSCRCCSACTISTSGRTPRPSSTMRCCAGRRRISTCRSSSSAPRSTSAAGPASPSSTTAARSGQDATGDPAVSARLRRARRPRHHRPRAHAELRRDRLDHVADAALVLDHVRRVFLRRLLRRVHRAAVGRRRWRCAQRACSTRSSAPSTCRTSASSCSASRRSGATSPSPSSS